MDGDRARRIVARGHAGLVMAIAAIGLLSATLGWQDIGPYHLLADEEWGFIGLFQAFGLMFLVCLVAWIGAGRWGGRLWNALLLAAELMPTAAIVIGWDIFQRTDGAQFATIGLLLHLPLIALETFALLVPAQVEHAAASG